MRLTSSRHVSLTDRDMVEIKRFIDRSIKDDKVNVRRLVADQDFPFKLFTKSLKGDLEERTIVIAAGTTLFFHPRAGAHVTNKDEFMVNAEGHGWGINLVNGKVKYFKNEIAVSAPSMKPIFNHKISGNGLNHS